jgi:predicted deacylase
MIKVSKRLIDVTGMRDVIQRRIPVMSLDSRSPGPVVWLTGCIHGDEPGGAVIIQDVFKAVRKAGLECGALHGLPLINSAGFENVSRFINSDREDLNRCFPGDPRGTLGERIAHRLFNLIRKSEPDLVIDLHNDWIQSVPYALLEPRSQFRSAKLREGTAALAMATGLLIVQESEASGATTHTLSGALVASDVPSFTVEAGGACGIVESSIAAGTAAVMDVLHELGMLSVPSRTAARRPSASRVLDYTSRPRCTSSGIIRFCVAAGDAVGANEELGRVYSAFGAVEETLRATRPGYVLGIADHARAVPGSEVVAIAEFGADTA